MKSNNRELFDCEFDILLKKAEEKIPDANLPDLPYMKEAPDVHEWYSLSTRFGILARK